MLANRMQIAASAVNGAGLRFIGEETRGGSTPVPFPAGTQEGDYLVFCRPNHLITPQVGGSNMTTISTRDANGYGVAIYGAVLNATAISTGEVSTGGGAFVYRAANATFTSHDGGTDRASAATVTLDLTAYSYDHYITVGAAVIDESVGSSPSFTSIVQTPSFDETSTLLTVKGGAGAAQYSSDDVPTSVQTVVTIGGGTRGILVTGLIGVTLS